jgi:hypothetical protein
MCEKVVVDFPEAWRKNIIEVAHVLGSQPAGRLPVEWGNPREPELPIWLRSEHALQQIIHGCAASSLTEADGRVMLPTLLDDPAASTIVEACLKHQVTLEEDLDEAQPREPVHGYDRELGF